ncbi:hypothetical protein SALBM311S_09631 [Streptomyces alboniger]
MMTKDRPYSDEPCLPASSCRSAIQFTISGPRTPAVDQAVSSLPWIAPTW